ncbi:enoyl-CoA hydratase-related protein [Rapidithrix thailandica]|uniref:Enoyl-CoA hydratase-related protein n=1 Tax=Rapidithrix thailandica TaxID=413964 RepID=A0AAW9S4S3_9BACT
MKFVTLNISQRIATITLNRPEKRNALNSELVQQLAQTFEEAASDTEAKLVILKAEGKAFCAGADLAYLQQLQQNSYQENLEDSQQLKQLFQQIYTFPKPVIAQVQGHAIAGGCGLATVCDFVFSVPEAKFGYTEVKIGFIPAIVMTFLLRKIGEGKTKQLLLTGNLIPAEKAQSLGLINYIVENKYLNEQVAAFARQMIEENSGQSLTTTKQMIHRLQEMGLEDGLNYAAEMNAKARELEDCQKGIAAFLNKEKPTW